MKLADVLKENITRLREELGISQRELGRRAKVTNVTISDIERGEVGDPKISTLVAIADGLETDVAGLLAARAGRQEPPVGNPIDRLPERERRVLRRIGDVFCDEYGPGKK
jgi:transcriptional regulator with XRE-family HTH domain